MIHNLRAEIDRLNEFPAMPELAHKILQLGSEPSANDLAAIVELDPGLAGQIVRYAASPFFGYRGKIDSIRDAISRVLGVERAMDLAFGASAGKAFRGPAEGPVGRQAVWVHAVYTAALAQDLAARMPAERQVGLGMAYLTGLLHNIGLLMLGHLFPSDLLALNRAIDSTKNLPSVVVENKMLGADHTHTGVWLLRKWSMPAEVLTAVHQHHNPTYQGQHAEYVHLVMVADRLLERVDLGDAGDDALPDEGLDYLGLRVDDVEESFNSILDSRADLDALAEGLLEAA